MRNKGKLPAWLRRRGYSEGTKKRIASAKPPERIVVTEPIPLAQPASENVVAFPAARMLPNLDVVLLP